MNVEFLTAVRDAILRSSDAPGKPHFDMSHIRSRSQCGSAMCIIGFGIYGVGDYDPESWEPSPDQKFSELSGLSVADVTSLGYPCADDMGLPAGCNHFYDWVKPRHAAAVIDHLVATGRVNWRVAGIDKEYRNGRGSRES